MLGLSVDNRERICIEMNKIIEQETVNTVNYLFSGLKGEILYPPNGGLTSEETQVMLQLRLEESQRRPLLKVIADTVAGAFFTLLNLIDGTGQPKTGGWKGDGVALIDSPKDYEGGQMLHDGLFEKYWDWKAMRKENWKLDNLKE